MAPELAFRGTQQRSQSAAYGPSSKTWQGAPAGRRLCFERGPGADAHDYGPTERTRRVSGPEEGYHHPRGCSPWCPVTCHAEAVVDHGSGSSSPREISRRPIAEAAAGGVGSCAR